MKIMKLRTRLLISFLAVIALLGILTSLFGFRVVKKYIVGKAQEQVNNDLRTVRTVYQDQLKHLQMAFMMADPKTDLVTFQKTADLDYVFLVGIESEGAASSEVVREAFRKGGFSGGTRLIGKAELKAMGNGFWENVAIDIKQTPKARSSDQQKLETAMAIEGARPFLDSSGKPTHVLYGGRILNKNFRLIDEISESVFENKLYKSKPMGTVTIFLDDVRVTTNVLDKTGNRAIGTKVSSAVYDKVVTKGERWLDQAFVVTDRYLTAYEPIKSIEGKIIGILYVGILEKPFTDLQREIFLGFLFLVILSSLIAAGLAILLANSLAKPMSGLLDATQKISRGDLESRSKVKTSTRELDALTKSFNEMAEKLAERDRKLALSNQELAAMNRTYLDLISFVSHELKGIISSAVLNVHSLRDEYLGELNPRQKKVAETLAKSLDYLSTMVRNFLSLSRIEKGELTLNRIPLFLKENVFDDSIEALSRQASEKGIQILNKLRPKTEVNADDDFLKIVANNLLTNAIKYGTEGGTIIITSKDKGSTVEVEVYNDGKPISSEEREKLFKRFSRLEGRSLKEKGTGIGLFIAKEIVEAHGGKIWAEQRPFGNSFIFSIERQMKSVEAQEGK